MALTKRLTGNNVLVEARNRIAFVFDNFSRIYVSFSGGKDSTVMLHLVMDEAIKRGRKVGLLFVDLEAQYRATIEHVEACFELYREHVEPYWIALPLNLRNAVSQYEPQWMCWEPGRERDWVRQPPKHAISDAEHFPFFRPGMEFEEFVPAFGEWFAGRGAACCFVGIRTQESLNRFRTIMGTRKQSFQNRNWTTFVSAHLFNAYPVYDWETEDVWTYHARFPNRPHNRLYDLMHKAGLTIHQMRICQPYGDDQRRGLWLFHIIEPETWARIVARVNGANQGALYIQEKGNILGQLKITKPDGHSWESFAKLLLDSMPEKAAEHYRDKIAVFLKWYTVRGFPNGIPDEADSKQEADRSAPSWRRICKALLRNDYWCKGLSFSQHKSDAYDRYQKMMKKRRREWKLI